MKEILIVVAFFLGAFGIFIGGLIFSQYKRRKNVGCCGGGNCATDGTPGSCYKEKEKFVKDYVSNNV
ncbi:MAG: hypothetical protein PVH88_09935 [Ignavibacteria bacterium]|jgi:hypothetical protein